MFNKITLYIGMILTAVNIVLIGWVLMCNNSKDKMSEKMKNLETQIIINNESCKKEKNRLEFEKLMLSKKSEKPKKKKKPIVKCETVKPVKGSDDKPFSKCIIVDGNFSF